MNSIQVFQDKKAKSHYDSEKELWFFSKADVVGIFINQPIMVHTRNYWNALKGALISELNEEQSYYPLTFLFNP
jgi:hypothetical protein